MVVFSTVVRKTVGEGPVIGCGPAGESSTAKPRLATTSGSSDQELADRPPRLGRRRTTRDVPAAATRVLPTGELLAAVCRSTAMPQPRPRV